MIGCGCGQLQLAAVCARGCGSLWLVALVPSCGCGSLCGWLWLCLGVRVADCDRDSSANDTCAWTPNILGGELMLPSWAADATRWLADDRNSWH